MEPQFGVGYVEVKVPLGSHVEVTCRQPEVQLWSLVAVEGLELRICKSFARSCSLKPWGRMRSSRAS